MADLPYVVVPNRYGANFIAGRSPLNISDSDIDPVGEGAVYIDGLTLDEAGALLRAEMRSARPRTTP